MFFFKLFIEKKNYLLLQNISNLKGLISNDLPNFSENLWSNLGWVAQLLYNVGMKLLPKMSET